MVKRKADVLDPTATNGRGKKAATEANAMKDRFGAGLFEAKTVSQYSTAYAQSEPYKHAVVSGLIDDTLLRSVRTEILDNIHFTPKETDIYKIHQSGDLANLDGLDPSALEKLPSLLQLRDALYSYDFRQWVSKVSGAGALSGKKTDMAVNVYVPGCHLLCHDDVIGSRRVSYILYLTDPDKPWQGEWGGALRLYPTDSKKGEDGKMYQVPQSMWTNVIPPAWNQLSFFAVQPGESFHDVEEVYHRGKNDSEDDGGRFRMAISGWFHIPQDGEEGFEPGLEEKMAEKSSLQQLQGKADQFDEPQTQWIDPTVFVSSELPNEDAEDELSEKELEHLLQFMTPNYLTPDTVEELNELFGEESTLQLTNFFNQKFAASLQAWLGSGDSKTDKYRVSRPPHKHRYQYQRPSVPSSLNAEASPHQRILNELLPSLAFRKWLSLATGLTLKRCSILGRRFRRGLDYQLAQSYEGEDPQLEYTLNITPTPGWGADEVEDGAADGEVDDETKTNGKSEEAASKENEEDNVGGYELYMAGDDADGSSDDEGSDDGVTIPAHAHHQSHTGAGDRRASKRRKADPAVYKAAAADEDEDDGILFSNPASWNSMSVVLRDRGTLRFVKYVSRSAQGDRWDVSGCFEVEDDDDGDEEVEAEG